MNKAVGVDKKPAGEGRRRLPEGERPQVATASSAAAALARRASRRRSRQGDPARSGYAEELVRVRHADAAHPARARARSGPCARAPASRSGSTSPEARPARDGARRGCRTRRSRTARRLRAPSSARAPSRPPRRGTSPRSSDPVRNADRAGRAVVVVVARVLAVDPADEPDVEVRVAIELLDRSARRRRGGRTAPEMLGRHRARRPAFDIVGRSRSRVRRNPLTQPGREVAHVKQADGVSDWRTCVTASPKPRTASSVGPESTTGVSLPYTSCPTPNVWTQSSIARRPCVDTSKNVFGSSAERTSTPRRASRSSWNGPPPREHGEQRRGASASARGRTRARRGTPPASAPGSRRPTPTSRGARRRRRGPRRGGRRRRLPAAAAASSIDAAALEIE